MERGGSGERSLRPCSVRGRVVWGVGASAFAATAEPAGAAVRRLSCPRPTGAETEGRLVRALPTCVRHRKGSRPRPALPSATLTAYVVWAGLGHTGQVVRRHRGSHGNGEPPALLEWRQAALRQQAGRRQRRWGPQQIPKKKDPVKKRPGKKQRNMGGQSYQATGNKTKIQEPPTHYRRAATPVAAVATPARDRSTHDGRLRSRAGGTVNKGGVLRNPTRQNSHCRGHRGYEWDRQRGNDRQSW